MSGARKLRAYPKCAPWCRRAVGNELTFAERPTRGYNCLEITFAICRNHIMPIHDWTRVPAGLFHHFHQDWTIELTRALNRGCLPKGVAALVEQRLGPREGDVLAIETRAIRPAPAEGGVATAPPPVARIVRRTESGFFSDRANRVVIKHHLGRIIAVIEVVSPGNKDSRASLREFVEKTVDFLRAGIHVLVIDLFPPTARDPSGIHKEIWDEFVEETFAFPPGKDRIVASYKSGAERVAYIEPLAVDDELPDMALFLSSELHIATPLESTYRTAWEASPLELRTAVETGLLPDADDV
jgi:hypothetical protein